MHAINVVACEPVRGSCVVCACRFLFFLRFATEISWQLDPTGGGLYGDPHGGNPLNSSEVYTDDATFSRLVCAVAGKHSLKLLDKYGDGWSGATISVYQDGIQLLEPVGLDLSQQSAIAFFESGAKSPPSPPMTPPPPPMPPPPNVPPGASPYNPSPLPCSIPGF